MKRILAWWTFVWIASTALGQTVQFVNQIRDFSHSVDAPFFDDHGIRLAGPGYVAQLYAWNKLDRFLPVGSPVAFATNGYFFGDVVTIPFVYFSEPVWVQVRAWESKGGNTFEQAALAEVWTGVSVPQILSHTGHDDGGVPDPAVPLVGLKYPGGPMVVKQPRDQTILEYQQANLSVVASSGVAMSYQWFHRPSDRPDGRILEATNASYITPKLGTNTVYWVTVSNSVGSEISEPATVTILPTGPGLHLQLQRQVDSWVPYLTIEGWRDRYYLIQSSTNLSTGPWAILFQAPGQASDRDYPITNSLPRFYRAVVE